MFIVRFGYLLFFTSCKFYFLLFLSSYAAFMFAASSKETPEYRKEPFEHSSPIAGMNCCKELPLYEDESPVALSPR